jgi:hypothetical protein
MTTVRVFVASAAVSGLIVAGAPAVSSAQHGSALPRSISHIASLTPGSIQGVVKDEAGAPIGGAMISALGVTPAFAFSDRQGRFELLALAPGPYLIRAYLEGFQAPTPEIVEVRSSGRSVSSIALRKDIKAPAVLTAGFGATAISAVPADVAENENQEPDGSEAAHVDEHETLWRLRHARRGILKSATASGDLFAGGEFATADPFAAGDLFGRAVAAPARVATSFFVETPFSGEVNFLTTGSFKGPEELDSTSALRHRTVGVAHVKVGAPVGDQADWTVSGALTQDDLSSWILAGTYVTRAPATHRYDLGVSYSAQRYFGGNPLGLRGVVDVTRNASAVHGFDTFTLSPNVTLRYGARYARYDYLEHRALLSPRVAMVLMPMDGFRVGVAMSRSAHAPGAEEFLPPGETGIWLAPQRTFSSIARDRSLEAERVTHLSVEVERDIAGSTMAVRAFKQNVRGQLLTLFGADAPDQPVATLGHYFVGNAGNVKATGGEAEVRGKWAGRVQGSVSYRLTRAEFDPVNPQRMLLLARAVPFAIVERIHDLSTAIEADVPETATRVLVVYRASNAFAGSVAAQTEAGETHRSTLDYRFDVQVRQSLPFMSFSSAKWEMLLAVRNFFRETAEEQSVYGELLVLRPPTRVVGGVSLYF